MKRGIAILLAALLLGLCACSPTGADASEPGGTQPGTQPATRGTETTAGTQQTQPSAQETDPTAETPEEPEINEAFTAAVPDAPEGALGVMFNEPLDGLELTVTQNGPAGEYDRAYIVAKYVGSWVNVFGVTVGVFALAGAMYGFTGFIEGARIGSNTANTGLNYELDAIAACVIGGVSFVGGIGKIRGIVIGVVMLRLIFVGLTMVGVPQDLQYLIKGAIILFACALDMRKYLVKK